MDLRPILYVLGIILCTLSVAMVVPMVFDLIDGSEDWRVFFWSINFTAFIGAILLVSNKTPHPFNIHIRQAFLLTALSWISIAAFSAIPFRFSELSLSYTDAFFEAMSGITTTGSTVMTDLEQAPAGILIWRAILQWLGGIGIIVMALSVLPMLKVGGMQLFKMESSESDKAMPRAAKLAAAIGTIYFGLTLACMVFYIFFGMSTFDALAHAMTTIATGGFSTHDASLGYFDSYGIELIATIFMIIGSLPFVLYLKTMQGNRHILMEDSQVKWFLTILSLSVLAVFLHLMVTQPITIPEAFVKSAFNITSIMTGTGYASTDFYVWGGITVGLFFFLMCVGGCAGSTTCGIKIFRFQILYSVAVTQIKSLIHPHGVFVPYYNGKPVPPSIPSAVMSFFFLFALSFSVLALILFFLGLDFVTAMSGAVSAISNVGPGLGNIIGPAGTYAPLPDSAKWVLSVGMLLGRLELFTLLVFLSPHFWRY